MIVLVLIRPIPPTNFFLARLCLLHHFYSELAVTLYCPFKVPRLSPAFRVDIKMGSNSRQELFRLVPFLRFRKSSLSLFFAERNRTRCRGNVAPNRWCRDAD